MTDCRIIHILEVCKQKMADQINVCFEGSSGLLNPFVFMSWLTLPSSADSNPYVPMFPGEIRITLGTSWNYGGQSTFCLNPELGMLSGGFHPSWMHP